MSQLSKAQFETKYANVGGEFATNGVGAITGDTLQEFSQDLADSLFIGTILSTSTQVSGATLRGCGTTPVTLVSAPATGYYINILSVSCSYSYGTAVYNFGGPEIPTLFFGSNLTGYSLSVAAINGASSFNKKLYRDSTFTEYDHDSAVALTLSTANNGDATTGDGILTIKVYYTIEPGV